MALVRYTARQVGREFRSVMRVSKPPVRTMCEIAALVPAAQDIGGRKVTPVRRLDEGFLGLDNIPDGRVVAEVKLAQPPSGWCVALLGANANYSLFHHNQGVAIAVVSNRTG